MDWLRAGKLPAAISVTDPSGHASAAFSYQLELGARATSSPIDIAVPLHGGDMSQTLLPGAGERLASACARESAKRMAREARARHDHAAALGVAIHRDDADAARRHPDQPRRSGDPARLAQLLAVVDSRRLARRRQRCSDWARADVEGVHGVVREVPVRQRQGAVLRRRARGDAGAGERQPRRIHLPGGRVLPAHPRQGRAGEDVAARGEGGRVHGFAPPRKDDGSSTPSAQQARSTAFLPQSISHEGYSAKPMHSYWDDFFALRGFKDAAFIAKELGQACKPLSSLRSETSSGATCSSRSGRW